MTLRSGPELKPRVRCSTDLATEAPLELPYIESSHMTEPAKQIPGERTDAQLMVLSQLVIRLENNTKFLQLTLFKGPIPNGLGLK